MRYTFDPAKLAANVAKHGVWFEAANEFEWATATIRVDDRGGYGETRFMASGSIGERVYMLVFTLRDTSVRLISLRRANRREARNYEQR